MLGDGDGDGEGEGECDGDGDGEGDGEADGDVEVDGDDDGGRLEGFGSVVAWAELDPSPGAEGVRVALASAAL